MLEMPVFEFLQGGDLVINLQLIICYCHKLQLFLNRTFLSLPVHVLPTSQCERQDEPFRRRFTGRLFQHLNTEFKSCP